MDIEKKLREIIWMWLNEACVDGDMIDDFEVDTLVKTLLHSGEIEVRERR